MTMRPPQHGHAGLKQTFGAVHTDKPGQPPLPTRLMAGLAILKHTYDLSDEALCDRWVENPYFQYFSGEAFFQHAFVFDRSSLTRCASGWGKRSSRRCCRRAWRWRPGRTR
jgi:transposase, IS5 family